MNKWINGKIGDKFNDLNNIEYTIDSHHLCANCSEPIVLVTESTNNIPEHPCSDMFPIILPNEKIWNVLSFISLFIGGLILFFGYICISFAISNNIINSLVGFLFYALFILLLSSIFINISNKSLDMASNKTIHMWMGKDISDSKIEAIKVKREQRSRLNENINV